MHQGAAMAVAGRGAGGRSMVADIAKLSVGREDYYVREVADNREEYLSGHGESPGRWLGRGAQALGQEGIASTEAFVPMFHGRHPDTGELLGRAHGDHGVPAFDVVLRPTKSVSLLYGLGDARIAATVLDAHHQATSEALSYLEDHVSQGPRRRAAGAWRLRPRWRVATCTATGWRRTRSTGRLPARPHEVAWGRLDRCGPVGNRELAGMPADLLRSFSKWADAIDDQVERLVAEGRVRTPKLVKWVVQTTRQASATKRPAGWRSGGAPRLPSMVSMSPSCCAVWLVVNP
jgi:hypothetical protein